MCVVIRDLKVLLALPAAALPSSAPTELPWHIGSSRNLLEEARASFHAVGDAFQF